MEGGIVPVGRQPGISPGSARTDDGNLVDFQVYMLCRVDRPIRIAVSSDMDIPMTYASLD